MRRVNIADPSFGYDPDDPPGFRTGYARFGPTLGATITGATVYELPPGQSLCPYHYEYGEEEWLLVLSGRPTVRHPEGSDVLEPWDVLSFPSGSEGAHEGRNATDAPVRVLMFSNLSRPGATIYPDSDKVGIWTGNDDDNGLFRRSTAVGYWVGETDRAPGTEGGETP